MMRKVMNLALKMLNAILLAALFFTELTTLAQDTQQEKKPSTQRVQPQGVQSQGAQHSGRSHSEFSPPLRASRNALTYLEFC